MNTASWIMENHSEGLGKNHFQFLDNFWVVHIFSMYIHINTVRNYRYIFQLGVRYTTKNFSETADDTPKYFLPELRMRYPYS